MEFCGLLNRAQQKIKEIRNLATDVTSKKVEAAVDCAVDFKKSLRRVSIEGWNQIQRRTKKEPFAALLIATGTGLVAGWLIGRDRG